MRRRFEEMTTVELAAAFAAHPSRSVAVLPFAATEQHGPHLPLGTDSMIADGMVETVLEHLPEDVPATFLPVLRLGKSTEHTAFPGTIDQGWQTATAGLIEIGESLARAGFARIVIVSSHGGNTPVIDAAALELRHRLGLLVATCSWMRFGIPEGVLPPAEIASGIHGGAVETALMMHFRPDLVRVEAIAEFASLQDEMAESAALLRAHGRLNFGWMAGDLNPAGVVGDARLASASIGRAIAVHQAERFGLFLRDVAAFDLCRLSGGEAP